MGGIAMENMNLFGTNIPIFDNITINILPTGYQAELGIHHQGGTLKLLAENTIYRSPQGEHPDMNGLDLYLVEADISDATLVSNADGKIKFPAHVRMDRWLYAGIELPIYSKGLLVTSIKPYHESWDLSTMTHTYVFGDFIVLIDIGPRLGFIITVTNKQTGESTKY
jgi:hypothetical protein